jgi:F1F0 ATPase subunit 2
VSGASTNGIALAVGALLGAIFFGGLWWTVRNAVTASNPALYFLASLLLRTGIVLSGFYYVSGNGLLSVLLCLCGFIIARVVVTRFARPHFKVGHAP